MQLVRYEFVLPVWSACPLANSDFSGCNEGEIRLLSSFKKDMQNLVETNKARHYSIEWPNDIDSEKYFHWRNDIDGQCGADVCDCNIYLWYPDHGYKAVLQDFRACGDWLLDRWGHCAGWVFSLCDVLTDRGECPEYWQFQQSSMGSDKDSSQWEVLNAYDNRSLLKFSKILYRYYRLLKFKGLDY